MEDNFNNVEPRKVASLKIDISGERSVDSAFDARYEGLGLTSVRGPCPLGLRDLGTLVCGVQRQEQTY